ncbi:conserved exported hypothetical protein [Flavobacterium sp. 9AF]|uniref:GIN domain-containing protein n=1 Tax=Flavobacterium sp. 9AF TaxID=2653142 RepID=UPI0012F41AE6|nr:DUF2807 domain-containing protein [Flavobacterium sp. 9AF]VXB24649.1 conserved exported hypothetical protein [Flavobacterium sp. 9AF]
MSKIIITLTTFLIGFVAAAQVSENRNISNFTKLRASTAVEIIYTVSNTKSLKVETDDNEKLRLIKTVVENETLKVYVDTEEIKSSKQKKSLHFKNVKSVNGITFQVLKVVVSGPNLENIEANSSAKIKIENINKSTNLNINLSSSAYLYGNFITSNLTIDVSSSALLKGKINAASTTLQSSSSSAVDLTGNTSSINVKTNSSASCNLKELTVEKAKLEAHSSASVSISVTKSLEAKATSSGRIEYYGNPKQINKEQNSSGAIINK